MVAAQHTGFRLQFLTGSAEGRMSAMFTEDEFRGGLTAWQTTPKYVQETERREGVHDTHAPVVLTLNVRARRTPLCLSSGISSQMQVQSFRLARHKRMYNAACSNAGPIRTKRVRRAGLARSLRLNGNPPTIKAELDSVQSRL